MELSCVLPSNAEPDSVSHHRALQERSGNGGHGYANESTTWKLPPVQHAHVPRFGGNIPSLQSKKTDEQVEIEFQRLWALLQRCEKFQRYRGRQRQPTTAKDQEQTWPERLERAFFRGLVRWPPMGKHKYKLNGRDFGRNELVSISIERETGIQRKRKKVSSHIQVLKKMFDNEPQVLAYMPSDLPVKGRTGSGQSRKRHIHGSPRPTVNKRPQHGTQEWTAQDSAHSAALANTEAHTGVQYDAPFHMIGFGMSVQDRHGQPIHHVTQLAPSSGRMPDLHFVNLNSWHKQYPELTFHRTEDWKDRKVLVCHASINIADKVPPGAELIVNYEIGAQHSLSALGPLECRTRFFDSGELASQYDERKKCGWASDTSRSLPFGSHFWVRRMSELRLELIKARKQEDPSVRRMLETKVQRSLQYMTAIQDVYSSNSETGENCFVSILWRFQQTRSATDPGLVTWRVANFPPAGGSWIKNEDSEFPRDLKLILNSTAATEEGSIYAPLPLEAPHHPFAHLPPPLVLDGLSTMGHMDSIHDFSNPNSATAPSMTTDYSQHSMPSLMHSQHSQATQSQDYLTSNDIDFNGGHITMHLEPAMHFDNYDNYDPVPTSLHPIPGLGPSDPDAPFGDLGLMANCYPSKSWHFHDVISRMEGAAEQADCMLHQASHEAEVVGHGVLHDGQLGHGLWKLQAGFGDDTGVGAADTDDGRKDQTHGIMGLIEKDRREGRLRDY